MGEKDAAILLTSVTPIANIVANDLNYTACSEANEAMRHPTLAVY